MQRTRFVSVLTFCGLLAGLGCADDQPLPPADQTELESGSSTTEAIVDTRPVWSSPQLDPAEIDPLHLIAETRETPFPGVERAYLATNVEHQLAGYFAEDGTHFTRKVEDTPSPWKFSMTYLGVGRNGNLSRVAPKGQTVEANRVKYDRGSVTEWYLNDERGIEQGFDIWTRPGGEGSLVVGVQFGGSLEPRKQSDDSVLLEDDGGRPVLAYRGLVVLDAKGSDVPAHFELRDNVVSIVVDDSEATYPLRVDPWLQTAKLTDPSAGNTECNIPSELADCHQFGTSTSVSGDFAFIGSPQFLPDNAGEVFVYQRSGGTWSPVAESPLTPNDSTAGDAFGYSVAVDGNTAVVGAWGAGSSGAAYVFRLNGGTWTEEARLTGSDAPAGARFGFSVAISGTRVLVGASETGNGAVYVFERSGGTWPEVAKLTASDGAAGDQFGRAVALDGDTALITAPANDDNGTDSGSAYIFQGSGGTWTETTKLTATDVDEGDKFGRAASLDGDTALVTAVNSSTNVGEGSGHVFERDEGGTDNWGETAVLAPAEGNELQSFGSGASIDGDILMIGATGRRVGTADARGAVYVFRRAGSGWCESH